MVANADKLNRLCTESYAALYDDDQAILGGLNAVWKRLGELATLDPGTFGPYVERRDAIRTELEELAFACRDYASNLDSSPDRLQQIEDRLAQIERLKLTAFRGSQMEKDLTGIFRAPAGGILPVDEAARVIPASLEQSNVKPTEVLVEMVEAQRSFDMRTKLIATAKELDEGGASLMRITPG